jgi:hypothetical protein
MPKFEKGNTAWQRAKGQGKSNLLRDVPARYDEGFLDEMDGRSELAKVLRQRLRALVSDLGGLDALSYQERSLCKRAVHLERLIEQRELTLAHNGTVDESGYFNAINVLSGLYHKLGMKRRARTVSLKDVLSQQPAQSGPQLTTRKDTDNGNSCTDQRASDGIGTRGEGDQHPHPQ